MNAPRLSQAKIVLFHKLMAPTCEGDDPAFDYQMLCNAQAVIALAKEIVDGITATPDGEAMAAKFETMKPSIVGAFFSPIDKRMIVVSTAVEQAVATADVPLSLDQNAPINYAIQSWRMFVLEKASGETTAYKIPAAQRALYEEIYASGKAPEFRVLVRKDMGRTERRELRNAETERLITEGYSIATTSWN